MPKEGYKQSIMRRNSRKKLKFKDRNPGAGRSSKKNDSDRGSDERKEDSCNSYDPGDRVTTPKKTASEIKLGTKQGQFHDSLDAETPRTPILIRAVLTSQAQTVRIMIILQD